MCTHRMLKKKYLIGDKVDNNNSLHIGYGVDNNYVRHMLVSILSFVENNDNIIVHIITDGFSKTSDEIIKKFVYKYNIVIYIYEIDSNIINAPIVNKGLTIGAYFRLFLPDLLSCVERILYVDADVICTSNLDELKRMYLENKIIAAVPDTMKMQSRNKKLGLTEDNVYVNSGVLLMDVQKWRTYDISNKIMCAIREYGDKIRYEDQDAINVVLAGKIKYIDISYNCIDMRKNKTNNAKILHFASNPKPWNEFWHLNANCNSVTRNLYSEYEKRIFGVFQMEKSPRIMMIKWLLKRLFYMSAMSSNRGQEIIKL